MQKNAREFMQISLMAFPKIKFFVNRLKCLKIGVNDVYYCANERPFVLIVVKSCKWLSFDFNECYGL